LTAGICGGGLLNTSSCGTEYRGPARVFLPTLHDKTTSLAAALREAPVRPGE
jgi:hypothetical protein